MVVDLTTPVLLEPSPPTFACDPDASYVITGGLGGFGAATARHLAARGARHLALIGRRAEQSPRVPALLAELQRLGAAATVHSADAGDLDRMRQVFTEIRRDRRIAGVVHAAMVLDDAPLRDLDHDRRRAVLAPKLGGGLTIGSLTADADFVVHYSSVSALIGNINQSSYAAANLALDALARRTRGGPATLSIQWGAVSDVGYVARTGIRATLADYGLHGTPADQLLHALDELLPLAAQGRIPPVVTVSATDWAATARVLYTLRAPRFAGLVPVSRQTTRPLRDQLRDADPDEALDLAGNALAQIVADILQTTPTSAKPWRASPNKHRTSRADSPTPASRSRSPNWTPRRPGAPAG